MFERSRSIIQRAKVFCPSGAVKGTSAINTAERALSRLDPSREDALSARDAISNAVASRGRQIDLQSGKLRPNTPADHGTLAVRFAVMAASQAVPCEHGGRRALRMALGHVEEAERFERKLRAA